MSRIKTTEVLSQLVAIYSRSLPMYLSDAQPWTERSHDPRSDALRHVAEDQKATIDRIGEIIIDNGGMVVWGEFPLSFTGKHDLSLDFLVHDVIRHQREDIAAIEGCVRQLDHDPLARAAAQEALGEAKGHLDTLLDLTKSGAGAGVETSG